MCCVCACDAITYYKWKWFRFVQYNSQRSLGYLDSGRSENSETAMAPTPVLLPGKSHEWRSLVGCSPWGRKELDTTEWLPFHFSLSCIGKEMATHSSVLAWRIPGTGEPAGLLSMGSHRIGHDWSDLAAAAAGQKTVGSLFSLWPYPWVVAGSNILSMCRWVQGHCAFCWPCEWLWGLTRVASGIKCLCG